MSAPTTYAVVLKNDNFEKLETVTGSAIRDFVRFRDVPKNDNALGGEVATVQQEPHGVLNLTISVSKGNF